MSGTIRTMGALTRSDTIQKYGIKVSELVWEYDQSLMCLVVTAQRHREVHVIAWITYECVMLSAFTPAETFQMFAEHLVEMCER